MLAYTIFGICICKVIAVATVFAIMGVVWWLDCRRNWP